jgi:hypothetical protein
MEVIRVCKTEFELEDGSVFPVFPPLENKIPLKEFQKIYDRTCIFVQSLQNNRGDHKDVAPMGQ